MKLEIKQGSENYACVVISLPVLQDVEGLDNLKKVTVFGNDCLVGRDSNPDELYLFFPAETQLHADYISKNNQYRDSTLNRDKDKKGFFEQNGRVKAIKFKGVISTGYVAPLNTLLPLIDTRSFKIGDEFTTINSFDLCKKYKVVHQHSLKLNGESRFNKKLKRFDKLVPNQFRFHVSTAPLAKNLHMLNPEDTIIITDKWHGTSGVCGNILVKRELSFLEKVCVYFRK